MTMSLTSSLVLRTVLLVMPMVPSAYAADPCSAGSPSVLAVTNNSFSAYTINAVDNPTLTVVRGCSYTFNVNAPGHPFWIKLVQGSGTGNSYDDGVTGNGTQTGAISWTVPLDAPDTLFYNCQFHAAMTGTVEVTDGLDPLIFFNGFEF